MNRRQFLVDAVMAAAVTTVSPGCKSSKSRVDSDLSGSQRLPLTKLREWESRHYGMFIHFGMSTFLGELPDGNAPASTYNPDRLDVDSWIQLARDSGMKYAVLTAKH